jgi:TorA maturation chaperone TorD
LYFFTPYRLRVVPFFSVFKTEQEVGKKGRNGKEFLLYFFTPYRLRVVPFFSVFNTEQEVGKKGRNGK